jgi:2-polyprenyl-3-methyl-5-hydroxy-6-metoxy-1,4-benzoquinol methylase
MKNLPAKFCISCSKIVPCKPIFKKNNFILGKCTVCGLAFILNPPNSKDLKNLYSFNTGYKKRLLNNYFEDDFKFSQNYVDLILNSNLPGKKILDVGCSAGFFLKLMKDHNYDTCGVELSEDLAKIGRNNFNLKIKTGKIEDIKEKFDLITFFDVIEHIENPDKDLNKAYSLLNDNGYLII